MSSNQSDNAPKRKWSALILALATGLFLSATPGEAAEPETPASQAAAAPSPTAAAPSPTAAVPVPEIAIRATEVTNLLLILNARAAPSADVETIRKAFPELKKQIDLGLPGTMSLFQEQPMLAMVQTDQRLWLRRQQQIADWLDVLTTRVTELQEALNSLVDLHERWTKTRDAAQISKAPEPVLQQITAVLAAIESAQAPLQTQSASVLELQSGVANEMLLCETVLALLAKAEAKSIGEILRRDSKPLWSAEPWTQMRLTLSSVRFRKIATTYWADLRRYLGDPAEQLLLHLAFFIALVILLRAARHKVQRWATTGEGAASAAGVLDRPYAAALLGALLVATAPTSPVSPPVKELLGIVAFAPLIRLTRPMVHPLLASGLFALWMLSAIDIVRHSLLGAPLLEQMILVVEALLGMVVLGWLLASGALWRSAVNDAEPARLRILRLGAGFLLLSLACGLVAGALGYIHLARLLIPSVFAAGALALVLYVAVRVLTGVVAYALRVRPLRLLQLVQHHRDLLESQVYRLLVVAAVMAWLARFLSFSGLLDPALSFGKAVLSARLEWGSVSTSLGDFLAFFLTVWVAYLLSAFLRFVLKEDVYPRTGITPGLSYATSSLLHYVILALGFVVGLGVLGLNLTKVTVLAGAFGVGIGFGLQSVVNNFVSGLILLFERPIHVGDVVEAGDLLGEVRQIGIRASKIRTYQGADMIIPNADLITKQVTNWTLSDRLRRIDLPVGVNYASAPDKVIEVLEAVARAHPRVLQQPAPQALFMGYGDSSLNYELRAWTKQFDYWVKTRSDLAVAVYAAVQEAGMSFPFPQREVRLLQDSQAESVIAVER